MTTVLESLNKALHQAFAANEHVHLLGEDLLDPYGGAFKVTRGLSSAYPERVWTSPISEAAITGLAAGMALRGLRPVVEIMFGDFITLAADQLVNHLAKFRWMYNEQVKLPVLIRTPMGGRRGYGPTHSQTLEKHFLGVPGLGVIAPCHLQRQHGSEDGAGNLLRRLILENETPTLFIENKLLYLLPLLEPEDQTDLTVQMIESRAADFAAPAFRIQIAGAPKPQITIATYGYMAEVSRQAMLHLAYTQEIFAELVVLTRLSPFDLAPVLDSVRRTGRLLTVEEGSLSLGWGAEVLARAAESLPSRLKAAGRVSAIDLPVPASGPLEEKVLPGVEDILKRAQKLLL